MSLVVAELVDREHGLDLALHVAIEMTVTGDELPDRREPVLPSGGARIWREAVLDEHQLAAGSKDTSRLAQRTRRIADAAQRIGEDDGIEARRVERQVLCDSFDELDGNRRVSCSRACEKLWRRIDADNIDDISTIEQRQIEPGSHADLEDVSACTRHRTSALFDDVGRPAYSVEDVWIDVRFPQPPK